MKKYLALALIAALAAFAAPAMADVTNDGNSNYTVTGDAEWEWNDPTNTVKTLTINPDAKLTVGGSDIINGQDAVISGSGTLYGSPNGVADLYGVKEVTDVTIDASSTKGKTTNIQLAAAQKEQSSGSVELTMMGVKADPALNDSLKHYLKVAPQFVRNDAKPETSELESARITVTDSAIGHSLFGGPLAISGNDHNLTITNSEIVINGDSQIGRAIYAGGGVWGTNNITHVENARIIVNGGTIGGTGLFGDKQPTENGYIYGGGLVEASGSSDGSDSTATVGTATIIINGGSVEGVRGGGRIERPGADDDNFTGAEATKVDNVEISVVGDAGLNAIGSGGIEVGGELVDSDDTAAAIADEVISSVTNAKVTLQNIENANVSYEISGMGADDTAALELRNVNGSLGDVDFFQTVGVDPNTSVSLTSLNEAGETPQIALVGDWRDTSGVQEFNLDEMIKVSGKTADELFSNADSPVYDPAETGITSLTRNADGSFRATVDRPAGTSGGGGGGCSAGFGALALLAALPLIRMRKK